MAESTSRWDLHLRWYWPGGFWYSEGGVFPVLLLWRFGHLTKGENVRGQCWQVKYKCALITFLHAQVYLPGMRKIFLVVPVGNTTIKKKSAPVPDFFVSHKCPRAYNNCWSGSKTYFHIWEGKCLLYCSNCTVIWPQLVSMTHMVVCICHKIWYVTLRT